MHFQDSHQIEIALKRAINHMHRMLSKLLALMPCMLATRTSVEGSVFYSCAYTKKVANSRLHSNSNCNAMNYDTESFTVGVLLL